MYLRGNSFPSLHAFRVNPRKHTAPGFYSERRRFGPRNSGKWSRMFVNLRSMPHMDGHFTIMLSAGGRESFVRDHRRVPASFRVFFQTGVSSVHACSPGSWQLYSTCVFRKLSGSPFYRIYGVRRSNVKIQTLCVWDRVLRRQKLLTHGVFSETLNVVGSFWIVR